MKARERKAGSVFTEAELDYLTAVHPLARLATVGSDGTPHVMPVGMYEIDPESGAVMTYGRDLSSTKKWRDVAGSGRAALVVDDIEPPFRPRGIELRGRAELVDGERQAIRLVPERIVGWGLDAATAGRRNARSVEPGSRS